MATRCCGERVDQNADTGLVADDEEAEEDCGAEACGCEELAAASDEKAAEADDDADDDDDDDDDAAAAEAPAACLAGDFSVSTYGKMVASK